MVAGTQPFGLAVMRPDWATCHAGAMAMRCLIVDDSARFLQAARALLEREGSVVVVGVASTISDALASAEALSPDIMLLDIDLGGESGFALARRLDERVRSGHFKDAVPSMILISTHSEEDFEELIAESPAIGFLNKSALSTRAIRDLLSRYGDSNACKA